MGTLWPTELSTVFINDPVVPGFRVLWQPFLAHCHCAASDSLSQLWVVIRLLHRSVIWDRPTWQWRGWQFLEHAHPFPSLLTPLQSLLHPQQVCLAAGKAFEERNGSTIQTLKTRSPTHSLLWAQSAPAATPLHPPIPRCWHRQPVFTQTAQAKHETQTSLLLSHSPV